MNRLLKVSAVIAAAFLFCFISVGYAAVTDIMSISGNADIKPQQGVFITDVSTADGFKSNKYIGSVLNSSVDLSGKTEITVNITVFNNTDTVYGYNVMKYVEGEGTYDNAAIEVSTTMKKKSEEWSVQPGDSLTFPVTFSFKKGETPATNLLNSVIDFEFLPFDEIPEDVDQTTVAGAMDRFEEILNTPDEKAQLDSYMDNVPSNDRNSTYISNVPGANATDIASIEALFEGNLHIMLDGVQTDVKIMIKEENVSSAYDGNEMVIYMTTDPLDTRWSTAVVYRCVFGYKDGVWIRTGEMQRGTANVCDYSSGFRWGTGSFNTDSWKAS